MKVISKKSKQPTPWFSDAIADMIKLKKIAKQEAEKSLDPAGKELFRRHKNDPKVMARQTKMDHLQSQCCRAIKNFPQKAFLYVVMC